jgi:hypothetical protein
MIASLTYGRMYAQADQVRGAGWASAATSGSTSATATRLVHGYNLSLSRGTPPTLHPSSDDGGWVEPGCPLGRARRVSAGARPGMSHNIHEPTHTNTYPDAAPGRRRAPTTGNPQLDFAFIGCAEEAAGSRLVCC